MQIFIDHVGVCVYYKGMKTMKKTIFVAMILALALALVLSFDMSSVAHATGTEAGETFAFNFDNGEFIDDFKEFAKNLDEVQKGM